MGVVAVEDVLFPGVGVRVTAVHVTAESVADHLGAAPAGRAPAGTITPERQGMSRNTRKRVRLRTAALLPAPPFSLGGGIAPSASAATAAP